MLMKARPSGANKKPFTYLRKCSRIYLKAVQNLRKKVLCNDAYI